MTSLSFLTHEAVVAAIGEFREVGRETFVSRYGYRPSRDYFLLDGDQLIDTKPLVAAAYRRSHPDKPALTPGDFSGGAEGAALALRRLGFRVGTRAELEPPQLGAEFPSRTSVYDAYGGDRVAGIIRFPGEAIVNVFSDAEGPYADDPPTLTSPFGYRGQGLSGPQRVHAGGNLRLEGARIHGEAVRFWYRPRAGSFTFLTWAVVLGRSWVEGTGADGVSRPELEWVLEPVPGPSSDTWPTDVVASLTDAASTTEDDVDAPEAKPSPTYSELVERVEKRGQKRRPTGIVRTDYARSAAARRAVLVRCEGICESPGCTGMPSVLNRRGEPILDVDHVLDLALGGEDHPRNMIALCPNCHAVKTRRADAGQWRRKLQRIAEAAHLASKAKGDS